MFGGGGRAGGEREGVIIVMHGRRLLDHRSSHPYDIGTGHVGFSPTRQTSQTSGAVRRRSCRFARGEGCGGVCLFVLGD